MGLIYTALSGILTGIVPFPVCGGEYFYNGTIQLNLFLYGVLEKLTMEVNVCPEALFWWLKMIGIISIIPGTISPPNLTKYRVNRYRFRVTDCSMKGIRWGQTALAVHPPIHDPAGPRGVKARGCAGGWLWQRGGSFKANYEHREKANKSSDILIIPSCRTHLWTAFRETFPSML